MNRVNAFIESLIEWKHACEVNEDEFKGTLFNLAYQLGMKNSFGIKDVETLKEHIINLISEQGIKEKFLVNSLILEINNTFEHNLRNHGDAIIINELMAESYKNDIGVVPDHIQRIVDRLKEKNHRYNIECEFDMWKIIIQRNFNYANVSEWDRLEIVEQSGRVNKQLDSLSDEEMQMTFRELREKYDNKN